MLKAGYKANVIPATAEAVVDCRFLPGRQEEFEREVDELHRPGRHPRVDHATCRPYETTFDGDLVDAMNAALLAEDPDARTVPVHAVRRHRRQGVRALGHPLLRVRAAAAAADLDFAALFHGVDERVPVDALKFGTRVLEHFLRTADQHRKEGIPWLFRYNPYDVPAEAARRSR